MFAYFRPPAWLAKQRRAEKRGVRVEPSRPCLCGEAKKSWQLICNACWQTAPEDLRKQFRTDPIQDIRRAAGQQLLVHARGRKGAA